MLTMTVRAKDLAGFLELPRSALGYGMFYNQPYSVGSQVLGAEGTLFTVTADSLVACTMATRNRVIIHASIPCANVDNNSGDLYALEAPKDLDRILRRYGDQRLALRFDDSRLEIVLPSPGNARRIIWLPLKRVTGHMLSAHFGEAATTFRLNADLLIAALCRVPRGERRHLFAIQPMEAGFYFQYPVNAGAASERLAATTLKQNGTTSRFVCSTRSIVGFVRVIKSLRKHSPTLRVLISASTLTVWNDSVTVQFFADRTPNDWKGPTMPDTNTDIPEIQLLLDRRMSDLRKDTGKWLQRLVRNAKAVGRLVETTWVLSHGRVVVEIDGGIQTALEIPCTCDRWPLAENEVSFVVDPLTTAAILEICQKGTDGCRLVYRDSLLTIQSSSPRYELIAHGILSKSLESVRLRRTDVHTTRTTIQVVPTHERGKQTC